MKLCILVLTCWAALIAAGCSTTDSRIAKNRAAFESWPADVREKVQAGRVDVGFTPEQVRVALGEPARKYTRTSSEGTAEVWAYEKSGPRFSIGIGGGSYHGGSGMGGGVSVGTGGVSTEDAVRVVFTDGRVSAIEQRTR